MTAEQGIEAGDARRWPSSGAAYFALFAIILATFLNFFDQTVFGMLAQRIKIDFQLTDEQLGFLGGPATIIFYVLVGIPLARLADIFPRKFVLAGGMTAISAVMALGGMAQTFTQFVGSRMFLGAGGSAHAPAAYSMLADHFPPKKITRAFALLQLGFIGGTTVGVGLGGKLVVMLGAWPKGHFLGLTIYSWQWLLIWEGIAGVFAATLLMLAVEPPRHKVLVTAAELPGDAGLGRRLLTFTGFDALKAIGARRKVYGPLFIGLALSAIDTFGLMFWRVPFMIRSYHWDEARIGAVMAPMLLAASLLGVFLGGVFVEWLAKRYKDANVRAATILFACTTVCAICSPLMPTGESSLAVMALGGMFGLAGAVPQNAAIQRVAPNEMRGQVTAFYLFMFTFFGAMGSFVVGTVAQRIVGNEADLWKALVIVAVALLPLATFFMWRGIKPYREEVERLEAIEAGMRAAR
ncbi:MFS transporter [Novosphingobium lentum]|uniref:MFS transporter n=1 Tax=Novosphingobium lentum TaxID=145287 RepID=UPI003F72A80A